MKNIELYRKGFTVAEIRSMNNLSDVEVEDFIKSILPGDLKSHKITIRNRIIQLYDEGYSINVINKKTFVSVSIIKEILDIK